MFFTKSNTMVLKGALVEINIMECLRKSTTEQKITFNCLAHTLTESVANLCT